MRKRIRGTPDRPRMCVFRSLSHIYVQVIDDLAGKTLAAASSRESGLELGSAHGGNAKAAHAVGKALAERAQKAGVTAVVFDRAGYRYHGRVKSLAEGAREGGLKF
jgi:large subunit ribosomal protein L18